MQRQQVQKPAPQARRASEEVPAHAAGSADRPERLISDLDEVLDEIDAILEENREHLENFTQLSGE
jgi:hypothetical protein